MPRLMHWRAARLPMAALGAMLCIAAAGCGNRDLATAPVVGPLELVATPFGERSVILSWQPAANQPPVTGYRIYRDDSLIATVTITAYVDTALAANTQYSYRVQFVDASGQGSPLSNVAMAATPAAAVDTVVVFLAGPLDCSAATLQLSAYAYDADFNQIDTPFVWSSSDASQATVSQSGLVTRLGPAPVTITATAGGKSGSYVVMCP